MRRKLFPTDGTSQSHEEVLEQDSSRERSNKSSSVSTSSLASLNDPPGLNKKDILKQRIKIKQRLPQHRQQ